MNLATGVPTSGVCDLLPSGDRVVQQLARLLRQLAAARARGRSRVWRNRLSATVQTSCNSLGAAPGPCAAPTACVLRRYGFARSASAMISRIARL